MKTLRLILVSVLVSVAGFQTGQPAQAAPIDNGSFMSLWGTYSHCQATTDIDQLREDALTLTNTANRSLNEEAFVLPLPGKLEKLVSPPAARFAVDVKAMAAACSLRAGSAAVEAGKLDSCQRSSPNDPQLPTPIRVCLLCPTGESVAFGTRDERHGGYAQPPVVASLSLSISSRPQLLSLSLLMSHYDTCGFPRPTNDTNS